MIIRVEPNAPNTKKFLKYVVEKVLEHEPLKRGKIVKVLLQEHVTPLPEFNENLFEGDYDTNPGEKIDFQEDNAHAKTMGLIVYLNEQLPPHSGPRHGKLLKENPLTFELKLVVSDPKGFYKFADDLGVTADKEIGEGSVKERNGKVTVTIKLFFNEDGKLWREGKEKHFYLMEKGRDRYKIMEYFIVNKFNDYYPTKAIAHDLGKNNLPNFSRQIGNINRIAKNKIRLKDNILEGKRGRGYKISATYKITMKS
ncbi:MAG: hypothetical protein A3D44_00805 [Candidatus Staskawiczbacteria bacterium RIFCSPHIGHO2_02_FULL_42_22]|uniref:Uncharacterized protein n=1 Tax=Candidatus Staskawiczbacteria bacterium RIFCSPHIGHO2_02_FULL_42_22 TaxID=1802207 RepID=A0A1G2I373_9BACT|nr:MAG: hypothetical protein A3D44_00805 [Candidatus Staskawiczbacteria bacterium RIFCSPHIGHO2_02_FULL_42_22]